MELIETNNIETIDWEVVEKPIFSNGRTIDGYKGLFRSDNDGLLSIQKSSYSPTKNDRFIEVAEKLNEITGFPIQNYYDVDGGKKTLAFLKCTESIQVCGHEFNDYLMLGNSFDGSTGFFIGNSSIMVRCENRFSKNFRQLQVNHTKNNSSRIDSLCETFDMFMGQRKLLFENMERFTSVQIDDSIRKALIERLTRMTEEERLGIEISTRKSNIIAQINDCIDRECKSLGNNAFGLFNGVTYYTTHVKPTKNKAGTVPLLGNPFGTLNDFNQTAFKFCNELVNN